VTFACKYLISSSTWQMILVDDLVVRVGLWGLGSVYIFPGEMRNKKCKTVILQFRINPVHHFTIVELSIKSPCLWTCFHPLSPISLLCIYHWNRQNVKEIECSQYKKYCCDFFLGLPFAPFVFTLWYLITFWVYVMHVWTCYEYQGYVTCDWACYTPLEHS
jgi:hypothetical protein